MNWVDPWGLSASDGKGGNGNNNLILSGLTKTLSGTVKTAAGLSGVAAGMFASAVLVADNGTGVLTVDDAALFVTVPFTAASGNYAFNGAKEAVDGLADLTAGVVGTVKTLRTWVGGKAKSAWENVFRSNNNDKLRGKPGEIKRNGKQETKIGLDGRAIKERHNTDHGNPKVHTNPHDHDITRDEEGNPVYSDPINYPNDAPPFEIDTVYVPTEKLPLFTSVQDKVRSIKSL